MKGTRIVLGYFTIVIVTSLVALPKAAQAWEIPLAEAATSEEAISLNELESNLSYLFPSEDYLTGLEYHSDWDEVERGNLQETSGIEVTYEARFDLVPEHDDELPHLNAYILPMSSQSAAAAQFEAWANSSYFTTGTWVKKSEGKDYFSYYTSSAQANDVIKNRSLEEGSLHLISYYENVLIVVNFYRTSGEYLRSNVSAYLTYLENDEETLSILSELVVYIEEALKFYTGTTFSIEGPSTYDYYASSASYSVDLDDILDLPRNGTLAFDLYLDDGSETGTLLDMSGLSSSATGAFTLALNENAALEFNFYDPSTTSGCQDEHGWHHLYSDSLELYAWQTVTVGYGIGEGLTLWVNGAEQDTCAVFTSRVENPLYLGDFPDDNVAESFVGYVKGVMATFSVDEDDVRYDDQSARMIFADVSEDHAYAEAIEYLKEEGIIDGYSDGTFRPEQEVNRVEILKMLLLGFDYTVPKNSNAGLFSDLEAEAWYLAYLNYAVELGIVQGYADGTYQPSLSVNRVEFLKILTKAYGLNLNDYPITELYPDTDEDAWYAMYVQYAKDNGLMDSDAEGNFNPGAAVSRGEVAETIYRLVAS